MHSSDTWRPQVQDIPAAFGLLTRLPVQIDGDWAKERGAASAWSYPLVGMGLGLICVLLFWILPPLPAMVVGLLTVGGLAFVTGAMHEDGLADTCDGLWGGWTPEQRLAIMKDSHIGVYGVVGLLCILGLRAVTMGEMSAVTLVPLIGIFALSRAAMVAVMQVLPNARDGGLSRSVGRPARETMLLALSIGTLACIVTAGVPVLIIMGLAALAVGLIAKSKINGQTGDILGATQQICEAAGLIALVCIQ